ncbi:protein of unknown function [Modicisalibacter ilicicola DSM 19980]|uniref:DUF945 domain-containing protein n=1 Tax=Modicisalibacter ilicicola DSM 19980 TaxID=1121942 RepID=A0A1M4SV82_9GAMM|nr:DUF945 family protein [Halomonas ilicicola]SHE36132.1 protein of unknown function [Halomonas ilicicola DSM 19980]
MRKTGLAIVALVVLVAGYLGAQAYSSHVFERELAHTLDRLRDDEQWQVARDRAERGWFLSRGRLRLAPRGDEGWRLSLPYEARHGVLTTRLSGALRLFLSDGGSNDERMLFGDLLDAAEPRWTAAFHTLDRRVEGRLDIAPFEVDVDGERFALGDAVLDLEGRLGDVRVQGRVESLRLDGPDAKITAGPLRLESRYRFADDGSFFQQRNELTLERLDFRGSKRQDVTLSGVRYSDETRLDEQLRVDLAISLDEAQASGERLLSGNLKARLDRIDGQAARRLVEQVKAILQEQGGEVTALDEAQVERIEPALLSALGDSPRFILEGVTLTSPLFGVDVRGSGELIFDGQDSQALNLDALLEGDAEPWRERLNGRFSWHGVPPLLALQLGLPPETRQIELRIEQGRLLVNGQPLASVR